MPASLNGILSIARSGLLSHQLALQVTGNNIANATTEGYSRQRADLVPSAATLQPEGLLGTGVRVADITRARDVLLDGVFRRETALFHGFEVEYGALSEVETALGEPTEFGLSATLDAFWNAWSDLANDPSSATARAVVVSRGRQLVDHFGRTHNSLDAIGSRVEADLRTNVETVNRLLSEVADINTDVAAAMAGGRSAPELADRRDRLLDELATLVPIEVSGRENGGVGVTVNGISVVEGAGFQPLAVSLNAGVWSVGTAGGTAIPLDSGQVGGGLTTLNDDFAGFRAELDDLAQGIVERVNALHATGTGPTGVTGINFFEDFGDPTTVTAQNLALNAAVDADSQLVAAGTPDGGGGYRAGENDLALALADLRSATTGGVLDGRSINGAYQDLAAGVGLAAADARGAVESHAVLRSSALERRESVSGVATDEELIKVVQFQAGYSAAARLVTVVDEMYQTLLSI